ncbi:unnamed protein product [Leptosia nina]|uniref:Uncharacterized protein n=1 Tax=Leptosia nina TaxID=320188 RepID=A0AAV1JWL6_9NEOP
MYLSRLLNAPCKDMLYNYHTFLPIVLRRVQQYKGTIVHTAIVHALAKVYTVESCAGGRKLGAKRLKFVIAYCEVSAGLGGRGLERARAVPPARSLTSLALRHHPIRRPR